MTNIALFQTNKTLEEKTKNHPCYSGGCQNARIHLPVAPDCNVSCNYCNRKFDCVNESRPGVTSTVLTPEQALDRFLQVNSRLKNLKVVGIAGPGDALANFENTRKTLELIRREAPGVTFCLSTNGLMLPYYASDLTKLGVTHVTITINAIDPKIGARIYREINFMGLRLTGEKGSALLLANQLAGLKLLAALGIVIKINVVMIKGINDHHIEEVIKAVKGYGVFISNIMPLIPASGSAFEHMPLTSSIELNELRKVCGVHLKQMYHCQQCRADAVGTLQNDLSSEFREASACQPLKSEKISESGIAFSFAVASRNGRFVDEHFGHAKEFFIYRYSEGEIELVEKRQTKEYCTGAADCDEEEDKLSSMIKLIEDCNAVLVLRIGHTPQKVLEQKGLKVVQTCGAIEEEIVKTSALLKSLGVFHK